MAAAVRAGHFTRSEMLVVGITLVACSGTLAIMGDYFTGGLVSLFENGIQNALRVRPDPIIAVKDIFFEGALLLAPILGAVLVAGALGSLLPIILVRRSEGRTAIPLPPIPKSRIASLAVKTTGSLLLLLVSAQVIRSHRGTIADAMTGDTVTGSLLWSGLLGLLAAGGAVLILIGLAEQAILRHSLWQSLHLSKSETRREQRAIGGDREARSVGLSRHRKEVAK